MRTNPNIILSGNQMAAPQLPDVNAMMQTRTAGMENLYAIEQQRAAQAQAAQKEQAAALVDALAPAYATAFKGGGTKEAITAAYNLLPPEIQPGVKGQIDKLMAMPSDDLRLSALEASLAGSDAGRTLLDRIPTEIQRINADIQRGQLEVSRANAAREAAEASRPAAGDYATVETAQGIFILNKKTGELVPATAGAPAGEGPINVETPPQVLQPKPTAEKAEETKKRLADEKRVKDLGLAVSEIERAMTPGGLIDSATGGYLSNLFDTAAAVFSIGTNSSAALARLAPIADLALKMVPRFEGPQSNYDVQAYKDAAGDLANPNVPASDKRAAAEEIVRLFKKYQNQFEYAGDGGVAAGGEAGGNEDPLGIR
jgi:hypothetical protein